MSFRLEASAMIIERLRKLSELALVQRQSRRFYDAIAKMGHDLIASPETVGEPLRSLTVLKLVVYHATFDALHVRYAIDNANRVVYLRSVSFMPNSGLVE